MPATRDLYAEFTINSDPALLSLAELSREFSSTVNELKQVDIANKEFSNSLGKTSQSLIGVSQVLDSIDLEKTIEVNSDTAIKSISELNQEMLSTVTGLDSVSNASQSLSGSLGETSQSLFDMSGVMDLVKTATPFAVFALISGILIELLSSSEYFTQALKELALAFKPLTDLLKVFGQWLGKIFGDILKSVTKVLSTFIKYLTKTEQGLALLKTAAIFFGIIGAVALVFAFKSIAVSAYSALAGVLALMVPFLPMIALGLAVATALTAVVLVLEDLYYFATGQAGSSVSADFFEMLGLSKKEIEEIRNTIKNFIDTVKKLWDNFTKGFVKLVPAFKKIFASLLNIAKSFFVTIFKLGFSLVKVFSGVWDIIKGIFTGNFDLIFSGFKSIFDGVKGIFSGLADYIFAIFENIMSAIGPLKDILGTVFGNENVKVETPKISGKRAEGGNVEKGKSYLVGEKGEPEVFTAGASGFITPKNKLEGGGSSSSSGSAGGKDSTAKTMIQNLIGTVNISISGSGSSGGQDSDLVNKFKELIRQASIEAAQELGIVI